MKRQFTTRTRTQILSVTLAVLALIFGSLLSAHSPNPPVRLGNDVSYPQCHNALPAKPAFGVVGVNGGLASNQNKCLDQQLRWLTTATGAVKGQTRRQLYVNTGNPGTLAKENWPKNNKDPYGTHTANPYGNCNGNNTHACAWQYGWNQAAKDVREKFTNAAKRAHVSQNPRAYAWWLDVEDRNSWQLDSSEGQGRNAAVLEGMTAYFTKVHAPLGIYSTGYQWQEIVGKLKPTSNLMELESWLAGAEDLTDAFRLCRAAPLTRGKVVMVQYVHGKFDYNHACNDIY
jgi:hypothetical protein